MANHFDRKKSLDELEGVTWGDPSPDSSGLVQTCHRLRRKPLCDLTAGDLRLMLGQSISLQFLVPLALDMLDTDPWLDADYYPGDLLKNVTTIEPAYWQRRTDLLTQLRGIVERANHLAAAIEDIDDRDGATQVLAEIQRNLARIGR